MQNKAITVYCLLTLLWMFTRSVMAFGPKPFFDSAIPKEAHSPAQLGYGHLTPIESGSEIGTLTDELLYCLNPVTKHEDTPALKAVRSELQFLLSLIRNNSATAHTKDQEDFLATLVDQKVFYNPRESEKKKTYPSGTDNWSKLSIEQKELAEKYLYLQTKLLPSENLKAVILLKVLAKKEGVTFRNMESLLKRSFFLIDEDYIVNADSYLQKLHRKEGDKFQEYINKFVEMPFYKIHKLGDKTGRIARRDYKKSLKSNASETYLKFLNFHQSKIDGLIESLAEGTNHSMVIRQAFAQGDYDAPYCQKDVFQIDCHGVQVSSNKTSIKSEFALEYFKAFRSYEVTETTDSFKIMTPLKFRLEDGVKKEEAVALLKKWEAWAQEFYNNDTFINDKAVTFDFQFSVTNEDNEETINLRKCWNASQSSNDCSLSSQADAKNLTMDLKKDVLLEEVGHHMGLTDEYQMPYYHYNPLGAVDSFMIAEEDYKLYPHHVKMILAPHFVCR